MVKIDESDTHISSSEDGDDHGTTTTTTTTTATTTTITESELAVINQLLAQRPHPLKERRLSPLWDAAPRGKRSKTSSSSTSSGSGSGSSNGGHGSGSSNSSKGHQSKVGDGDDYVRDEEYVDMLSLIKRRVGMMD